MPFEVVGGHPLSSLAVGNLVDGQEDAHAAGVGEGELGHEISVRAGADTRPLGDDRSIELVVDRCCRRPPARRGPLTRTAPKGIVVSGAN